MNQLAILSIILCMVTSIFILLLIYRHFFYTYKEHATATFPDGIIAEDATKVNVAVGSYNYGQTPITEIKLLDSTKNPTNDMDGSVVNKGEKINDKKNSWAYHASLPIGESLGKSMPNVSSFITEHPVIMDETLYTTLTAGNLANLEDWHIALFIIMFHQYSLIPDTTVGNTYKYSLFNALLAIKPVADSVSVTQSIKNLNRLIQGLHPGDDGSGVNYLNATFNSKVILKKTIRNLIKKHFSTAPTPLITDDVNMITTCFKHSLCNHANNELPIDSDYSVALKNSSSVAVSCTLTPKQDLPKQYTITMTNVGGGFLIIIINDTGTGPIQVNITPEKLMEKLFAITTDIVSVTRVDNDASTIFTLTFNTTPDNISTDSGMLSAPAGFGSKAPTAVVAAVSPIN